MIIRRDKPLRKGFSLPILAYWLVASLFPGASPDGINPIWLGIEIEKPDEIHPVKFASKVFRESC